MSEVSSVATTTLADVLPVGLLDEMLAGGYVRRQTHPELPLSILNYSEKAAYENVWNEATLQCRGLIHDEDGRVVARPFRKFFNYGQPGAPDLDLEATAIVMDKVDGSLGILYPHEEGHAVATRGSFASDQAIHATATWRERYAHRFEPPPGVTCLFEIVYPGNRIVVDYGDMDDLILLSAVDIATGRPVPVLGWPGPVVDTFEHGTLADALAAPERPNAEGFVVYFPDHDEMLKIKQEDYVRLHRIVTGLNARTVWQHICDGLPIADLIEPLPDEFHLWVERVACELRATVEGQRVEIERAYDNVLASLPDGWTRKDFAALAVRHPFKWALFMLLDGGDPTPELWKAAKPEHTWTPSGRTFSEDTA